jgi:hypothetical protein
MRMSAESPHKDATVAESESIWSQTRWPIRLPDEPPTPALPRATSGAKGLLAYTGIGMFLVVAGALLGWAIAARPFSLETVSASGATPTAVPSQPDVTVSVDVDELTGQVFPVDGYVLPVRYNDIGPRLLDTGAIDYWRFSDLYAQSGNPLSVAHRHILTEGSDEPIRINADNSHFLLNFLWALGLANRNPVLTEGPMVQNGENGIGGYASTGGWTLGSKPATELYASQLLIHLTPEQQARVEEVAALVYRPCCGNPTLFPDCNHGMAMLGLLELMASQGASSEEMLTAAKQVNVYWFPQQTLELAVFFKLAQGTDYADIPPQTAVGIDHFSYSGYSAVSQWLDRNGLLDQLSGSGVSCGVG